MTETFEEYVRTRAPGLLRFAYVVCGDRHLAEDLVQEVLARVCRKWARFCRVEQPDAYLRTALTRQFLSWRRRRSSRELVLGEVPEPGAGPDPGAEHALRDELWQLLAGLPRRQRTVLALRYYEDLPDERIAEVMGCRPGTVRAHAHRALATLRGQLTRSTPADELMTRSGS